ncbi:transient receptor potential cation channel subfamily M member 2-like isoform X2 [Ptychodera flava]|uniref:transient receptor potential cation channel subfamily M member 2-like isoform X2 n=1 Tax=Ptychodera flava TaxID=63121 RepID=UPI003969CF3A
MATKLEKWQAVRPRLGRTSNQGERLAAMKTLDFNMRLCTKYVARSENNGMNFGSDEGVCHCGRKRSDHEDRYHPDANENIWSTTTSKTNAYGEIEFPGYSTRPAKYIRLDHQSDPDKIVDLMLNYWDLKLPNLLISVTGGAKDFTMTPKLKSVFRSGLTKVALSTNAWIITGGTHSGVMKHVGEAVRDYTLGSGSYGRKQIVNIGITPWGVVHRRNDLINKHNQTYTSSNIVSYRVEYTQGYESSLDPNHSHFILVDDGTVHNYDTGTELRGKIEKAISEHHHRSEKESKMTIPIVCLVFEGGIGTLKEVVSAVENATPTVIIGGSGRAADLLAWAIRNAPDKCKEDTEEKETTFYMSHLRKNVEETLKAQSTEITDVVKIVNRCINKRDLFTIYELKNKGSSKDIDLAILNAVVQAKRADQMEQLRLALAFNRIDIAESVMSKSSSDLHSLLHMALVSDQVQFVKLFIENGVCLREFLTVGRLTKLYNTIKRTCFLHRLLSKVKRHKPRKDKRRKPSKCAFTLVDVGNLIQQMTDDSYQIPTEYRKMKQEHSGDEKKYFDNPRRELFLWSMFQNQHDMAKLFLEEIGDTMAASLVAMQCLKCIASRESDIDSRVCMERNAAEYEQIACDILTQCYNDNENQALLLLIRQLPYWGNSSCSRLAVSAGSKNFIAHTAVQELLSIVWYGKIDRERTSTFSIICCTICPPLLFCIVKYREPNAIDDEDYDQEIIYRESAKFTSEAMETFVEESKHDTKAHQYGGCLCDGINFNDGIDICVNRRLTVFEKVIHFFKSPVVKFCYSTFSYIVFLLLFSYILLVKYDDLHFGAAIVLTVWVTSLLFDEIRQIVQQEAKGTRLKLLNWIKSDNWNIVDSICLAMFYIGLATRYFGAPEIGRYIWAVDIWFFYFRMLHVFSMSRRIGPKVIMIRKMMVDLSFFIGILFVIMVGYGVAAQAVLSPGEESPESLFAGVFYRPYFQLYGELFLDEMSQDESCTDNQTLVDLGIQKCSEYRWFALVLMALYMMLSNVLLLNLLIAMFSYTFAAVQDNTDIFWKYQRYGLIVEYQDRPTLCPPLIILSHIWLLVCCLHTRLCGSKSALVFGSLKQSMSEEDQKNLSLFELINTEKYMESKEVKATESVTTKLNIAFERLEQVAQHVEFLDSQLDRLIPSVDDRSVTKFKKPITP